MKAPLRFRAARAVLRLLTAVVFDLHAEGLERLPRGPHLIACNHLGWVDPFLLLAALPAEPRIHFLGRRSAIYNRAPKRWILRFVGGVIPVEAGELDEIAAAVGDVLRRGGVVAVFPEGRTGPAEGSLLPLRRGAVKFAAAAAVPIVAVGLSGTLELWRGKTIRLRAGRTLAPDPDLERANARLEQAIREAMPTCSADPGRRPWPWLTNLLR